MKKSLQLLAAICLAAFVFYACTTEDDSNAIKAKEKIQFSFDLKSSTSGRVKDVPPGSTLIISVQDENGTPVFSFKEFELYQLSGQFFTEPIELSVGNYTVTDFLVIDRTDQIIYVAPKEGAPLASLVSDPLPLGFTVTSNGVNNVGVEVISTSTHVPSDFGYASFNLIIREGLALPVNVLMIVDGKYEKTAATVLIMHNQDTVSTQELAASAGAITMPSADDFYMVIISAQGYSAYYGVRYSELMAQLNGKPLRIILNQPSPYALDKKTIFIGVQYTNRTIDGDLYPGAFTELDWFGALFTVRNDTVVMQSDVWNDVSRVSPERLTYNDCESTSEAGWSWGAMNCTSITGYVTYDANNTPHIHLTFTHQNTHYPQFSLLCGTLDQYHVGGHPLTQEYITHADFVYTNTHDETYTTPDGFVVASLHY